MFNLSIGIMAYNEEANIRRLLLRLLKQELVHGSLNEIIVVASGCSDGTAEIVETLSRQDLRIKLYIQVNREGKASAINLYLSRASGDIYILESGDTLPEEGTIEKLIAPFLDPRVGMTGAHPIPVNDKNNFIGYVVHLMWALHHKIALASPKLGEMVAFRNFVKEIPEDSAVDEASIEALVRESGYELRYVPEAVVRNKGPENIKDFIKQRRRIAAGHKHLLVKCKYEVSTLDPRKIAGLLLHEHSWGFKPTLWTAGAICLELIGRLMGYYDYYIRKKNPFIWDIATSTKKLK